MEKIKLNELGDVFRGMHETHSKLKSKGKYLYLTGRNIQEGNFVSHKKDKFLAYEGVISLGLGLAKIKPIISAPKDLAIFI